MAPLLKREKARESGQVRPLFADASLPPPAPAIAPPAPPRIEPTPEDRLLSLLGRLTEELVSERGRLLVALRPELLQLVFGICEQVLGHEVSADRAIIQRTLTEALQNLHFATRIVVRLHPDDLEYLKSRLDALPQGAAELELVGDDRVSPGGCLLDSDRGGFDATLQTQLRALRQALESEYNG